MSRPKGLIKKTFRFYHTVKHLTLKQVAYRFYYRVRPLPVAPKCPNVTIRSIKLLATPRWADGQFNESGNFTFMGLTASLNWHSFAEPKIWLYNLHYLNDLSFAKQPLPQVFDGLVKTWITQNPYGKGIGWEPYPLSLRIVNLIRYFGEKGAVPNDWLQSLYQQAFALSRQVEFHILANHLFANAKALIFAGCYFRGTEPNRWFELGLKLIKKELTEQFLEDGGHFERSPMYHSALIWDVCDLLNLARGNNRLAELQNSLLGILQRGLSWARAMGHPDGEISFFNDACFGIAPPLRALEKYALILGLKLGAAPDSQALHEEHKRPHLIWLDQTGFASICWDKKSKVLLNLADKLPNYQPGHAHADTLSFELSIFGRRVVVNSGISEYGQGSLRQFQRSTASHSTVEVNGENSSQIWAGFRVGRRARIVSKKFIRTASGIEVIAAHDGYHHNLGGLHTRRWVASARSLAIVDTVGGCWSSAFARYYLAPDVQARIENSTVCLVTAEGCNVTMEFLGAQTLSLEVSSWYPTFGKSVQNTCIIATLGHNNLEVTLKW
ncbi:heparinase II/III family protein [Pseudomonas sp. RIT-PI-S]|uniref:heparinase II/III family protein n=1 Tax=Pseudomonas sp. RIT-PI-S TaxID=3035295 RepID=UPI0021D90CBA|nr:heparinase II/III family protein [Pseudomonas sp. RIT-PI-S]